MTSENEESSVTAVERRLRTLLEPEPHVVARLLARAGERPAKHPRRRTLVAVAATLLVGLVLFLGRGERIELQPAVHRISNRGGVVTVVPAQGVPEIFNRSDRPTPSSGWLLISHGGVS